MSGSGGGKGTRLGGVDVTLDKPCLRGGTGVVRVRDWGG